MTRRLLIALLVGFVSVSFVAAQRQPRQPGVAPSRSPVFPVQHLAPLTLIKSDQIPRNIPYAAKPGPDLNVHARNPWIERLEHERYNGFTVVPHPQADGDTLTLHKQVGAVLSRLDFVPDERIQHFAWLKQYPVVLTGWEGQIEEATRVVGGTRVRLLVFPQNTGGIAAVNDYTIENYFLSARGVLQYLGTEEPEKGKFRVITIN